jgi:hypothetical protein
LLSAPRYQARRWIDSFQKFFNELPALPLRSALSVAAKKSMSIGVYPWLKIFAPPRLCVDKNQRLNRVLIERARKQKALPFPKATRVF